MPKAETAADRYFTLRVKPLLSEKCFSCHGNDPEKIESGLNMLTRESLLAGGDIFDDVVIPGDSKFSFLMEAVRWEDPDFEMPPKENDRLTQDQIWILRDWIDGGAHWPDEETQERIRIAEKKSTRTDEGMIVETTGALSEDWAMRRYQPDALWSYLPTESVTPVMGTHPIDAFVNQKLVAAGVEPAPPADPRTLVRRVAFDLTGLPPSPAMVKGFLANWRRDSEAAYTELVNTLLDSPQYGERQAQYWLDVTRYADTSGGSNDYERSGVWRYRDYVVRSFNEDKPYDDFVQQQIAGDLLNPGDPEGKVGVGFLRMGPWEATNMTVAAIVRQEFLDDVVNHVGETFLAQPLRCAKCHDHKFDPIPTNDYYSFMAVFENMNQAEISAPFVSGEVVPNGVAEKERIARELERVEIEVLKIDRTKFDAQVAWLVERGYDSDQFEFRGEEEDTPGFTIMRDFPADHQVDNRFGLSADEITYRTVLGDRKRQFTRYLERYEPVAYTVYEGPPNDYYSSNERNPIPTEATELKNDPIHILTGGELESPSKRVYAGALSCVETLADHRFSRGGEHSPRVDLARWIASPENPLTKRAIVNRIWQQHFSGKGIVATPNNFGFTGARPSHPELLDYLADWFVDNGWSIKELHRLIVSSETYRRSSQHPAPESFAAFDPNGDLLAAYPVRRMHAEEMRDAMLSISGELNLEVGGPPVFPEINLEAATQPRYIQVGVAVAYQPSALPSDRHRRTLYGFRMRGLYDPFLEVFNKPNADLSCERRDSTTVTPQVFSLFNGQQPHDRSLALAKRLESYSRDPQARIARAYELVYGRPASNAEIRRALDFVNTEIKEQRANIPEPVAMPVTVTRSMVHEKTGVESSWQEYLDIYDLYFVSDLKPWDVDPETRALASFCLVLFNSNEFLYLE